MKLPFFERKHSISQTIKIHSKFLKKKRFWRIFLMSAIYAVLVGIFMTAIAFAWFSKDLPTPSKIANRKPTVSTKLYDRTGETLLYETGEQKRTIVKSDQISPYLKDATVAVEDVNFYNHHGVDPRAIASAVLEKITGKRQVARGGSTITQQYVKNALLTSDRSLVRKIKEAILAVELEFMYNKDEILTMYLNEIPYGNATAGAEAASKMYFGKSAKDLTLAEAATLAAIPKAPTTYSPYGTHVDKLIARRNYILDLMERQDKASKADIELAKTQDTTTLGVSIKPRRDSMLAPHFAMYVLEQIANEYGEEKIQKEGLKIITTLDLEKQKAAEEAVAGGISKVVKYGGSNAALVATDPKTGQIVAMVGSKDYFDTSIDGNVNVADSPRQPGSSFKPIVYSTAFKQPDYSPSKIIFDLETDFGGGYIPHNYNGKNNGPVTMRFALDNSLNVPAVKVMSLAGLDNVLRTAEDLGITTLTQRDRYGLSLALGAGEVKPVEMAGAFSTFANGGYRNDMTPLIKVTDSGGKVLYDFETDHKSAQKVLDEQIAYEIANILSDNQTRSAVFGAHSALYFPNRTVAAKTGTTTDFKDAWTVGFTPSISVAIWTGNSDASKMSSGADGSVVAAPIFHSFIEKALAAVPNEEFTRPEGIKEVTVEKYSNKLPGQYTTETTTDIFAAWQVPTEQEDLHKTVKICRGTNKLAPDNAPANLVEEKSFINLHSERPDNPNWENPVRVWAEQNGLFSIIPTEYCDPNSVMPTVKITNPANGSTISGETTITINVGGPSTIKNVEYFVDDVLIGNADIYPYRMGFNFSSLSKGTHKLSALATDVNGIAIKDTVSFETKDGQGPKISNLDSKVQDSSALISWTTDEASTGTVRYYVDGNSTTFSKDDKNSSLSHQLTITGLLPNKKYNFLVLATDSEGNLTTSATKSFQTGVFDEENGDSPKLKF